MDVIYRTLRRWILFPRYLLLKYFFGFRVERSAIVSFSAILDKSNPSGVYIGKNSIVTSRAIILSHDFVTGSRVNTIIGNNCFIGVGSIVLPGVRIGDGSVVGAGSLVTKDVPAGSLVVGNPARFIRTVEVGRYGKYISR